MIPANQNAAAVLLEKLGIRQVPLADALVLLITLKTAHRVPFA